MTNNDGYMTIEAAISEEMQRRNAEKDTEEKEAAKRFASIKKHTKRLISAASGKFLNDEYTFFNVYPGLLFLWVPNNTNVDLFLVRIKPNVRSVKQYQEIQKQVEDLDHTLPHMRYLYMDTRYPQYTGSDVEEVRKWIVTTGAELMLEVKDEDIP